MKTISQREGLLNACQLVSAAIPTRATKPVLQNLKAIADENRFTLMATDLELGIRMDVLGLTVLEPGEAILPALRLTQILKEARDQELMIEADTNSCIVRGQDLEFEMPGDDPSHFPDLPTFQEDKYHQISAGILREMIRRTVFATADENTRYMMTGVLWELQGTEVRLASTDSRRLALAEGKATPHGDHSTEGMTPIVPAKTMTLLERNLQDDNEQICVCFHPNEVLFRTERAVIYSRLVEGRFPNYRDVINLRKTTIKVPIRIEPFLAAVRQAAIMADDEIKRVVFNFTRNRLILHAQGAAAGRSKVETVVDFDHKDVSINLNPQFLIEMLKILPGEETLILEMVDGASPVLFRHGGNYTYVVMPLS